MSDIIQLLPDAIANQIAAGEVIQRPASVVKELMENAVDSGADHIQLIIKDSGKTLIQVIDNGCGMSETDARLSLERHATSKLRKADDLFAIRTMGFRGEALASIAAVAQLEMRTRRQADELGTRLLVEGSEVKAQEPCQTGAGTSIAVKNLFYNVPARRNFLKSNSVEMRHINDEFQRLALANPDIHFSLHHNTEEVQHLPPGNQRQRVVGIFGQAYNKRLVPIGEETDIVKISGFVGKPEFAKKTRGEQFFFVNRRFIKSGYLNHAILSAYEDLIKKEAYPFYVVFMDINPERIDVNIHPTKQEIKFDDERAIYKYLAVAVRHGLGQHSQMPMLDFDQPTVFQSGGGVKRDYPTISGGRTIKGDTDEGSVGTERGRHERNLRHWESLYEGLGDEEGAAPTFPTTEEPAEGQPITLESRLSNMDESGSGAGESFRSYKDPYQIHQSYIVSQIKSGFLLIDQQAAHERILYEQFLRALQQRQASSQRQLFARTLELSPADAALLTDILPQLQFLGFDIEPFGQNAFVVNGVPAEVAGNHNEEKVIDHLLAQHRANLDLKLDTSESVALALARSAATKRGRQLTVAEMKNLIDRLFACEIPFKSPSGRNCFLTYELDDLQRQFEG